MKAAGAGPVPPFDGQMHGFFTMVGILPGCDQAIDYFADAVAEQLGIDRSAHVTA